MRNFVSGGILAPQVLTSKGEKPYEVKGFSLTSALTWGLLGKDA